jgi:hypothetical protein
VGQAVQEAYQNQADAIFSTSFLERGANRQNYYERKKFYNL